MRIVSKYHDYYDCMMDPSDNVNFWHRKKETIERRVNYMLWYGSNRYVSTWAKRQYDIIVVGFCGHAYPVIRLDGGDEPNGYFYDLDFAWEAITTNCKRHRRDSMAQSFKRLKASFESIVTHDKICKDIFTEFHTPYFIRTFRNIYINPVLADIKFYRLFDVYHTFQEIEMYLFGVLGGQREVVPHVPDKVMIEAKGFDLVTSFRKGKSDGKKRRR